ncbi:forkhead-associated domain-containing protein 1-like isoform X2 [Dysidea avara]
MTTSRTLPLTHYDKMEWEMREYLLQKDQQLLKMNNEINRMAYYESECKRKDELISALREELGLYQRSSREKDYKYVELEEMLSLKDKEIVEKSRQLEELTMQLKQIESNVKMSSTHGDFLHKELTQKDTVISSLRNELKSMRQNNKAIVDQLNAENTEKQCTIASLQDRLKNLRNSHQSLQKRHETVQREKNNCSASEQELRKQLSKLRNQQHSSKELRDQLQMIQEQHVAAQERESKLLGELKSSQKQGLDLCVQITNITGKWCPRSKGSSIPNGSEALLGVSQLLAAHDKVTAELEEVRAELQEHQAVSDSVQNFLNSLDSVIPKEVSPGELQNSMDSTLQQLHQISACDDVAELKVHLCTYLQSIKVYTSSLRTELLELQNSLQLASQEAGIDTELQSKSQAVVLLDKWKSVQQELKDMQNRITSLQSEHSSAINGVMSAMKMENEQKLTTTVEAVKQDEKEQFQKELNELKQHMEVDKTQALEREQQKTSSVEEQLKILREQHNRKELECQSQLETIVQLKDKVSELENKLSSLTSECTEQIVNKDALLATAKEEHAKLIQVMQLEVNEYKEQSRQHAITIVALEQKLLSLVARSTPTLTSTNTHVEYESHMTQTDYVQDEEGSKQKDLVAVLRRQLDFCQQEITTLNSSNGDLERQLKSSFDQTEMIKDKLQNENSQQVGDLQIKLGEQEDKLLAQKNEIKRLREQLEEKEAHITELVATIETKESLLAEALNTTTAQENHDNDMQVLHSHRDDTTETNTEVDTKATSINFSRIGTQCLGEEHQRVIKQQKEALAQLRAKLKQLEETKPPVPQHEAALREIVELRRKLNEFQANSLNQNHLHTLSALDMKAKVERAKQKTVSTLAQVSAEQSALKDSTLALDLSEKSYFNLLNSTCKSLSIDVTKDSLSLMQVPQNLRQKVLTERRKVAEVVSRQIKELTQHVNEKDHLLATYQCDLQTIKKTSEDTNSKLAALESLMSDAQSHIEQNSVLRNDMSLLQEELDQQQRLIQALLRRKNVTRERIPVKLDT